MVEKICNTSEWLQKDNLVKQTDYLVEKLFEGKKDKSGKPYVGHLRRVSSKFNDETAKVIALLHDTLEDTTTTMEELKEVGYSKEILDALLLLTRKNMSYDEYIQRIIDSKNSLVILIKIKDMEDNMDESRLCHIEEKEANRLRKKYQKYYPILKESIKEIENYVRY